MTLAFFAKPSLTTWITTCLVLLVVLLATAPRADASSFSMGEQLTVSFTQTSPVGSPGKATFTLGAANTMGLFAITSFSTINVNGGCLTCSPGFTDSLSGILFNPATGGLTGMITGSFLGKNGGTHTFTITVADNPFTWSFSNTKGGVTTTVSGTYTPAMGTVPEPASLILISTGMLSIAGMLRRKRL